MRENTMKNNTVADNSLRPIVTLGMFDMLKGLLMIPIVLIHTLQLYPFPWLNTVGRLAGAVVLPAFFIENGFTFRKQAPRKAFLREAKSFLRPYLFTAAAALVLFALIHYLSFRYLPGTLSEASRLLAGFVLGQVPEAEYFGHRVYACGGLWFFLALVLCSFYYAVIARLPERIQPLVIIAACAAGWFVLVKGIAHPYCLAYALLMLPPFCAGYYVKKRKLLECPFRLKETLLILAAAVALAAETVFWPELSNQLSNPIEVIEGTVLGFGLVYLCTRINRRGSAVTAVLEKIGSNSLYVLCVHIVEGFAVPWYLLAARFEGRELTGCAVIFLLRCLIIAAGTVLIVWVRKHRRARKQAE